MSGKKTLLPVFLILVTFFSFAQTKHALIVAIGNYPTPEINKWEVISSAHDVPLIKNALIVSQHFDEKNIQVIMDSEATRKGILDAMDKLYESVNKGDIVVIHFSSHGQQLEDDNNDEIDGLDEAIVPYGAVYDADPNKADEISKGYIRDDLFGEKINRLRNKLGKDGDVLIILDACHSGSGTRGAITAKVRGGNAAIVSNRFNPAKFSKTDSAGVFKESIETKLNADAASMALISAAQARELNYECEDDNFNPVGSLSYSFSKAISSLNGKDITYRGLFALIENVMSIKAPKQKPVLEGDGIDRELFGGRYVNQEPYITINKKRSKDNLIELNGGFVSGITNGSVISFYESATTSTAGKTPIVTGKVVSSNSYSATVKPDSLINGLVKMNPWAFISELAYGAQKLKVLIKGNNPVSKMLMDSLKNFQLVEINNDCDLFLDTAGSVNKWALKYPNSNTVFEDGFVFTSGQDLPALKEALKRFDRFRYLKGLTFTEQGLSAKVDLIFIDDKGNIDSAKLKSRIQLGRLELRENDNVYLRIVNTGRKNIYINIVDIQPDGKINPILPNKNVRNKNGNPAPVKAEDCLVKIADTLLLRDLAINIQKPFGEETFKIFLSSSLLDLEDILTSSNEQEAVKKRGVLNGLEKIFVNSNTHAVGKRGGDVTNINTDRNGTIFSLNFLILPQQDK